jgi:UDP-N-acetylglucosamine acyltransferase
VHPRAIVDSGAILEDDVEVGPNAVIEAGARVGAGTRVFANAVIARGATLGPRCEVHPGAVIGGSPQDRHWRGEESFVVCGADNIFREGVTINVATGAGARTVIGDRNFFMSCSHVAHNGTVGNDVVFANGAGIGGHALVEDRVFLSASAGVHQFCRVGTLAMMQGHSAVSQDVPPFMIVGGVIPFRVVGLNIVGLRRAGVSRESRLALKRAFQSLYRGRRPLAECLAELEAESAPEVARLLAFIRSSKRGIVRRSSGNVAEEAEA